MMKAQYTTIRITAPVASIDAQRTQQAFFCLQRLCGTNSGFLVCMESMMQGMAIGTKHVTLFRLNFESGKGRQFTNGNTNGELSLICNSMMKSQYGFITTPTQLTGMLSYMTVQYLSNGRILHLVLRSLLSIVQRYDFGFSLSPSPGATCRTNVPSIQNATHLPTRKRFQRFRRVTHLTSPASYTPIAHIKL